MIKLFTILVLTLSGRALQGQTFDEWFKQGKTQKKYLVQQIAALQVHRGYVEKGFAIAESGLTAIHNVKKRDVSLHSDYFHSVQVVNPRIKNDARVAGILVLDAQIKKVVIGAVKQAKKSTKIDASEKAYIEQVLANLVQGCKANITLLLQNISSDQLKLTDDERWKKIGGLYDNMEEKYAFVKSFTASFHQLIAERSAEELELENEKKVLGIK